MSLAGQDHNRKISIQVKTLLRTRGVDIIGIASHEKYENAPLEYHPRSLLPDFRAVVVLGWKWKPGENVRDAHSLSSLLKGAEAISAAMDYLTGEGYQSVPVMGASLSLPRAGEAAGLGEVGPVGTLITPEHGPRLNLAALITNAPLIGDKGKEEVCIKCDLCTLSCPAVDKGGDFSLSRCIACGVCVSVCPVGD